MKHSPAGKLSRVKPAGTVMVGNVGRGNGFIANATGAGAFQRFELNSLRPW